eukprot:6181086-Pleurochrysis_carterae.AAC.4
MVKNKDGFPRNLERHSHLNRMISASYAQKVQNTRSKKGSVDRPAPLASTATNHDELPARAFRSTYLLYKDWLQPARTVTGLGHLLELACTCLNLFGISTQ